MPGTAWTRKLTELAEGFGCLGTASTLLLTATPGHAQETESSIARGGRLYDKWWKLTGAPNPRATLLIRRRARKYVDRSMKCSSNEDRRSTLERSKRPKNHEHAPLLADRFEPDVRRLRGGSRRPFAHLRSGLLAGPAQMTLMTTAPAACLFALLCVRAKRVGR